MSKSSLILRAQFPEDRFVAEILSLPKIPCICKIGQGKFLIEFLEPLFEAIGEVVDFDLNDINGRVPVGAGGEYLHYSFALITLRRVEVDEYLIHDLAFFKRMSPGWFPIVEGGNWAPPWNGIGDEEDVLGVVPSKGRLSKKRKRLLDLLGKIDNKN